MKLSVVIPAYMEPFLQRTIDSLLEASELGGSLEIIPVIDGPWMKGTIKSDPRVKIIQKTSTQGMRRAINSGIDAAIGDYIMKVDAHCAFAPGFDRIMVDSCADDWLVIPRRKSLDEVNWTANLSKPDKDYHYLLYPETEHSFLTPHDYRRPDRALITIDDTMSFQGSCWLANKKYFDSHIESFENMGYGTFAAEQLEIGLKYWLGGGQVKVNKLTWYAHLCKMPRHYASGQYAKKTRSNADGWRWATDRWMNNKEPGMKFTLDWLVEKFWPVPSWPEDRRLWSRPVE